MLENEWLNLNYTSEINTENLTLLEFENLIKNIEGASPSVRYKSVKSLKERLVIELGLWLDNLENDNLSAARTLKNIYSALGDTENENKYKVIVAELENN